MDERAYGSIRIAGRDGLDDASMFGGNGFRVQQMPGGHLSHAQPHITHKDGEQPVKARAADRVDQQQMKLDHRFDRGDLAVRTDGVDGVAGGREALGYQPIGGEAAHHLALDERPAEI